MTLKEHTDAINKLIKKQKKELKEFGESEYQRGWNDGKKYWKSIDVISLGKQLGGYTK